jgi:hypothetical protein
MGYNMGKKLKYDDFKSLFDEGWDGFKGYYFNEAQRNFEKEYTKIGKWGWCQSREKSGILTEDGDWDDANRINTHPNLCKFFYEECIKDNPDIFVEFGNPQYHKDNVTKLWEFIIDNFDLYFTKKITSNYHNLIYGLLNQSWQRGNISLIIAVLYLKKFYPNIQNIEFGFKTGDKNDMNGIDIEATLDDDTIIRIQVKGGRYTDKNYGGKYYVNGSSNDLKYDKCDYYIYTQTKYGSLPSSFIMFKNTTEIGRKDKSIIVPADEIKFKIQEDMGMPENLADLMKICGENNIQFQIKKEEELNYIKLDEENKTLIINFSDYEDDSLEKESVEMLNKLKEMFK